MTKPLSDYDLSTRNPADLAIFFDFDGTLVEFADDPGLVKMAPDIRHDLSRLRELLNGAVAIVTGRDIADIDKFLVPLIVPVAGVHGLVRRDADGTTHHFPVSDDVMAKVRRRLREFVERTPGLLLEEKQGSVALHYRTLPALEPACIKAMDAAAKDLPGLHILRGKMVVEAKATTADKGAAIANFMAEKPFVGRQPVFAGDDVTDEDAFKEVNSRQGLSIKVGPGRTHALYRLQNIAALHDWLGALVHALQSADTRGMRLA